MNYLLPITCRSRNRAETLTFLVAVLLVVGSGVGQETSDGSGPPRLELSGSGQYESRPTHVASLQPIEGGRMIAKVGSQVVLASELLWPINQRLAEYAGEIPPEAIEQIRDQAYQGMQQQLSGVLDLKLILNDLHARIPPEGVENVQKHLAEPFEEQFVPRLMEQFSVKSRGELDARLRRFGSSIAQYRQEYLDNRLARMWIDQQMSADIVVTPDELHREYQARQQEYAFPARVRWEELMVRFDRFGGDSFAARRALAEMGNQVLLYEKRQGGAPLETVAKQQSHGFTASEGGYHDWTAQGSLVATQLDAALFSLPVGDPSRMIETDDGLHIVRVLERQAAGVRPFSEVQANLREKLIADRKLEKQKNYLERLRRDVQIWTVYTGPTTAEEYAQHLASLPSQFSE